MTSRFDAQLRQHLLETANERPADGQVAAIVGQVGVTRQRRRLPARLTWWPGRIGPFPSATVRYGLVAAALVTALVAAVVLGAGSPTRSTVFEGRWTTTDIPDGSTMYLDVGAGATPTVQFEDLFATGAVCVADEVKVFTADGIGDITGTRLEASFPNGGGCGLDTVLVAGIYEYDAGTDTIRDQDDLVWVRVEGGPGQSEPPSRGTYYEGTWTTIDQPDGSTMNLYVGPGTTPSVRFEDLFATGAACVDDEVKVFTAEGTGEITLGHLTVSFPDGGGCGSMVVEVALEYDYDPETDTIRDQGGIVWSLVRGGDEAPTTLPATDVPATDAPAKDAPATEALPIDAVATDAPSAATAPTDAPATDPELPGPTPEVEPAP